MTAPLELEGQPLTEEAIRSRIEPAPGTGRSKKEPLTRRRTTHVIAVYSPKRGAGCSTLAANLAIVLRRRTGRETILVDAAPNRGELDLLLNLRPEHGLGEALQGLPIDSALTNHPTGINLLGSTAAPAEPSQSKSLETLLQLLGASTGSWAVVDIGEAEAEGGNVVIEEADRLIVPLFLDVAHLRQLKHSLAISEALRRAPEKALFAAWSERTDVSIEAAARILGCPIHALPFEPGAARRAINRGTPIVEADPDGPLARALGRLTEELTEPEIRSLVKPSHGGPLSRLWGWFKNAPALTAGA